MADIFELEFRERGIAALTTKVNNLRKQLGFTRDSVSGLATRFVGLQTAVRYVEQAIRNAIQYINDAVDTFRAFELGIAEVNTILTEQAEEIHRSAQYQFRGVLTWREEQWKRD